MTRPAARARRSASATSCAATTAPGSRSPRPRARPARRRRDRGARAARRPDRAARRCGSGADGRRARRHDALGRPPRHDPPPRRQPRAAARRGGGSARAPPTRSAWPRRSSSPARSARLPARVIVYAVEGRRFEAGAGLSDELEAIAADARRMRPARGALAAGRRRLAYGFFRSDRSHRFPMEPPRPR